MSAALRPVGPRAGVDYPTSLTQFLDWFGSDADCARYLARLRWPDGFSCPKCGHDKWWPSKRYLYVCAACGRQTSLTSGTIFDGTRLPLLAWFRAAWMVSSSKSGVSAKELQRELGIGYHAAWLLLQKLRLAMVRPGRDEDKLSGDIEVDESYLGGPTPGGKRGRGAEGKVIIAIAVERKGFGKNSKRWKLGRTRIQVVPDVKGEDAARLCRGHLRARLDDLHRRPERLQEPPEPGLQPQRERRLERQRSGARRPSRRASCRVPCEAVAARHPPRHHDLRRRRDRGQSR